MTTEEIQAEITIQKAIVAACNAAILRMIETKSTINTSDGQTQLMGVERRIAELRQEKQTAAAEVTQLEASLVGGGGMLQLRPF